MVTDRVGDFIIRLQNAAHIGKADVSFPYSTHLYEIAKKLKDLGYIAALDIRDVSPAKKELALTLSYDEHGEAKLRGVKRISKPGRRLYVGTSTAHSVKGGTGARIISSPKGILSDREARKEKVGGEALFEIW